MLLELWSADYRVRQVILAANSFLRSVLPDDKRAGKGCSAPCGVARPTVHGPSVRSLTGANRAVPAFVEVTQYPCGTCTEGEKDADEEANLNTGNLGAIRSLLLMCRERVN
ncbi:hypothetical protein ACIPSA_29295 [Streptomyces sp. NPDC086549]|uniref:hypothetical protein n=1 Tax=Streptomyces sp. NPDC086549 TaxID=3365752 RepID=UPI003818CD9F